MEFFGFAKALPCKKESSRLLDRMKTAVLQKQHRKGFLCKTFTDDVAGFGACLRPPGNRSASKESASLDGPGVFLLDGRILEVRGERPADQGRAPIDIVQESLLRGEEDLLPRLNGTFNIVFWNKAKKSLLLATDRYGFKPVFLHRNKKALLFSTDIDALLAAGMTGKEIDDEAIHDFLNFQFVLGNKTFFKSISVLPPGTMIRKTREGQSETRYWQYPSAGRKRNGALPDLVAEGAHLLERAVQKQLAGSDARTAVTLSGGLDSRVVSGFVARERPDVGLFHGRWHAFEAEYARQVAQALGVPLFELDLADPDWKCLLRDCHPLTAGHLSCHQFWLTDLVREIAARGYGKLFDGVLLDVVFQPHMLTLRSAEAVSMSEKIKELLFIYPLIPADYSEKYFSRDFALHHDAVCRQNMAEHLATFAGNDLLETSQYFYCTGRGRGYIWPMINLNAEFIEYACPGLDNDLFDFGTALPVDLRRDGLLYRKIIHSCFPQLAAVPGASTKLPLTKAPSQLSRRLAEYLSLLKYATSRALRAFRAVFLEILDDERTYQRRFFSRNGIEKLTADIDRGKNLFSLIETMTTMELFFRKYIDEDVRAGDDKADREKEF